MAHPPITLEEIKVRLRMLRIFVRPLVVGAAFLLIPIFTGAVAGVIFNSADLGARCAGIALEIGGLFIVWRGLDDAARALGLETTTGAVRKLWRHFWGIVTRRVPWKITGHANIVMPSMTLQGRGRAGFTKGSSLGQRLDALEEHQLRVERELDTLWKEHDDEVRKLRRELADVQAQLKSSVDQLSAQVRTVSGGGLHAEAFGLILVALGTMFATFPEIAAGFWPFSLAESPCLPVALGTCFAD